MKTITYEEYKQIAVDKAEHDIMQKGADYLPTIKAIRIAKNEWAKIAESIWNREWLPTVTKVNYLAEKIVEATQEEALKQSGVAVPTPLSEEDIQKMYPLPEEGDDPF